MGKYKGKIMSEKSRYADYLPSLSASDREAFDARIDRLNAENRQYCDRGNYGHLQEKGMSKEDAFDIVSGEMWKFMEKGAVKMRTLLKPNRLKLMGVIVPLGFKMGSRTGWEYRFHKTTKKRLQFECLKCIYAPSFSKYGMSELGPMYCHADDINYGHLPGSTFTRHHTPSKDGEPCDFLFTVD